MWSQALYPYLLPLKRSDRNLMRRYMLSNKDQPMHKHHKTRHNRLYRPLIHRRVQRHRKSVRNVSVMRTKAQTHHLGSDQRVQAKNCRKMKTTGISWLAIRTELLATESPKRATRGLQILNWQRIRIQ